MLKKKLNRIFKDYKKRYKLKTRLLFNNNRRCAFNCDKNYISYDVSYVENTVNNRIINKYETNHKIVFCLLHEIKHSIDLKYNKKRFDKEDNELNYILYKLNVDYALAQPFEKRANKFAKKELEKWIKH